MSPSSDPSPRGPSRILTPDQRLRVFVSSTLQELADERRAAKAAIETLRLAPVMFELGARPYPPRELYRAYLEQSQIFVGIYGRRYGWVAPGESISGLEDEYDLAGARPKLIYVKRSAEGREPRLDDLLARIQADDRASYKPFESTAELRDLVENDLALLLTERFAAAGPAPSAPPSPVPDRNAAGSLPVAATPLVGRHAAIDDVVGVLLLDEVRLVTLLGPGGIGKTRLAMAVAERLRDAFADGVVFVPLATVRDPARVFDSVLDAVGLKLEGGASPVDTLAAYLRDKDALIVLDNCEQVIEAATGIAELLRGTTRLRLLATSRVALRLSAEHVIPVAPLGLPSAGGVDGDAVELFLERARAVRPDVAVNPDELGAVAEIVRRLQGLPLAIELAASRTRLLAPRQLLPRLERSLELLTGGPRDLPERQRTLRATLDWSFDLLRPDARRLLVRLGVFMGGFSLEAARAVGDDGATEVDVLEALEGLVEHSLVQVHHGDGEARFGLLETVREYALEHLDAGAAGDGGEVRSRHARTFLALAERLGPRLKVEQRRDLATLVDEGANLRLAIEWCLRSGRGGEVVRFAWALWLYWWIRNDQERALPWVEAALALPLSERERVQAVTIAGALYIRRGDTERARAAFDEALPTVRTWGEPSVEALVLIGAGLTALTRTEYEVAGRDFAEALELFRSLRDPWGIAFVHAALGRVALGRDEPRRALELTAPLVGPTLAAGDENTAAWVLHVQGLAGVALARLGDAARDLGQSLELFWRLGNLAGTAHVIGSIAGLALAHGDARRALRLAGAAEAMGEAVGALPFQPERSLFEAARAEARRRVGDGGEALEDEGGALGAPEALAYARESLRLISEHARAAT